MNLVKRMRAFGLFVIVLFLGLGFAHSAWAAAADYIVVDLSTGEITELPAVPPDLLENKAYKGMKLVMRRCPAGSFMMGEGGKQHNVKLTKDFYIGVFEVTQGQWEKVMKSNPSVFLEVGMGAPVENVSWNHCEGFIKKLNGKAKTLGFRLPTEAEWEYAVPSGYEGGAVRGDSG